MCTAVYYCLKAVDISSVGAFNEDSDEFFLAKILVSTF